MRDFFKKSILFLALALVLSSCSVSVPTAAVDEPEPEISADEPVYEKPAPEKDTGYHLADTVFTINYDPASTLSPIYGTNTFNNDIMSLIYEGLFRVTPDFGVENVLCESWETEDGVTFFFHLIPGVTFHDGTPLTAEDVVSTVNLAAGGSKYSSRFSIVKAINAVDELTFSVVLYRADLSFPNLLDLPIIKTGTSKNDPPTGSGPYVFVAGEDGTYHLDAYKDHRDYDSLPVERIYLTVNDMGSLTRAFASKEIDLLNRDTTGLVGLNFHGAYETRYYDTTNLIYLGFNEQRGAGSDPLVRKAISKIFNRADIVEELYGSAARVAPTVLSSALSYYDKAWEKGTEYRPREFYDDISTAIVYDWDNDGYWDNSAVASSLDITLIVNEENDYKIQIAKELQVALESNGLRTELKILSYTKYLSALKNGDFSIYVGEVKLTTDFDLTSMFAPGGSMNYGKISDPNYELLIGEFLAADSETKAQKAGALAEYVRDSVDIIPVCYKKYAVQTHLGEVTQLSPSVSGVFTDIKNWKIDLGGQENGA